MKRILTLFIIFLAILSGTGLVFAENITEENMTSPNEEERIGEKVTTKDNGYLNISFNDSYNGYCIDKGWNGASSGDTFTVENTSNAMNNNNGEEIGNYLKILFVDYHDLVTTDKKSTQNIIWGFSNDYHYSPECDSIIKAIKDSSDNGRTISDHGETIDINNTTKATFDFEVLNSGSYGYQSFFGYKITYKTIVNEIMNNTFENILPDNQTNETEPENTTNNTTTNENTTEPETTNNTTLTENQETIDKYTSENDKMQSDHKNNPKPKNHITGNPIASLIAILLFSMCILKIRRD